jgi:hypothetical protein
VVGDTDGWIVGVDVVGLPVGETVGETVGAHVIEQQTDAQDDLNDPRQQSWEFAMVEQTNGENVGEFAGREHVGDDVMD